jgi:hypothetical protein
MLLLRFLSYKSSEFALRLRYRRNGLSHNLFLVVIPIGIFAVSRKKFLAEYAHG